MRNKPRSLYKLVLFDLDGTLSDSAYGIRRCIELTLDKMGYDRVDLDDYSRYVGPPLVNTFNYLCGIGDMEKSYEAVRIYTDFYDTEGIKENRLYDGLSFVLKELKSAGVKLAVCSSKAQKLCEDVVELLDIGEYFDEIIGSLPGGIRKEKKECIEYALKIFDIPDDEKKKVILIGDSTFDCIGAREAGVGFLGVCYGYGKKEDMIKEGARQFASAPAEILPHILITE